MHTDLARTVQTPAEQLDLGTVLEVQEVVSGETNLEGLIATLMRLGLEHAGAERGLLILPAGDAFRIEGEAEVSSDVVNVGLRQSAITAEELPESVLHYVLRTRETLLLHDASAEQPFSDDEYVRRRRAHSVLCMPLLKQTRLVGLIYLENDLAPGVFTPARMAVLKLLASAAAVSLENARRFRDLQEREARIRRLVDSNIIGIVTWHADGRVLDTNDAFLRIVGYSREELLSGRVRWTDLIPLEWHDDIADALAEIKDEGTDQAHVQEYIRKDGARVPVLAAGALFDGTPDEGVAFVLDLTEHEWAGRALRATERESRLIMDTIPGLVGLLTATGEVEMVNRQLLEYFGQTLEELRQWGTNGTVHPEDLPHVAEVFTRSIESGSPYNIVQRFRRSDGVYRWFENSGLPLRDTEGRIVRWCVLLTDIDERKRAEALLASEKRLLEMVASGSALPVVLDALCTLVEDTVGRCSCSLLLIDSSGTRVQHGSAPSLPATYTEAIDGRPLEPEAGPCGMAACLNTQVIVSDVLADTRWEASGWRRVALAHGLRSCWSTPINSKAGHVLGTFAIYQRTPGNPTRLQQDLVTQVTHIASIAIERAQSEAALRRSERNLKLIIDTMPALAWSTSPDGAADFFNQHYLDYVGLSAEQASGWGWTAAIHPEDINGLAGTWQRILSSEVPGEAEARLRRHDGEYRWFLFRAGPLRDESGAIVKWYGVNTDIEGRKRAEVELRRAYDSFADAQRLSHTGSFITDLVGDDHNWSEETYRIFEFDPATKVTVQRIRDIIHPDDLPPFDAVIARAMTGENVNFAFRIVTARDTVKHVRGVAHVIEQIEGRPMFVGALQDVTESMVAEEALNRARSELAHVARVATMSTVTASIAHEVNQPLSGIITNASTCVRMLAADPPNVDGARETAKRTIRDGHRASDVITRLRALFSKKELTLEPVDLNDATREVIALSLSELQRNRVIFQSELAGDLPSVTGDRVQLQQVILNLLRNASEAMAGVDDRPRHLLIRTEREDGDRVRVSARDAGVGIDPQSVDKLFNAFYTTKSGGMGMGLSVSRSIIERHHGRLWAEPNDGPGATFAFSIPCCPESSGDRAPVTRNA